MVSGAGWWWTFGMVILLGLAALAAVIIIVLIAVGFAKASDSVGLVVGILLFLLLAVFFPPYSICYVSVLYVASGGEVEPARPGGLPGIPPAPPAPPAFGALSPPAADPYGGAATGVTAAARQGGDDAWKAAADPLAGLATPAPPLAAPASQSAPAPQPAPAPAGGDAGLGQTAVTGAVEPAAPEPPAPPAPPGQRS